MPPGPVVRRWLARRRNERGYALVFTAIILIPLLAISAMATDIGAWYDEGTELQKAADAAALAGVVWLPDFNKARSVALESAKSNGYDDASPTIDVVVTQPSRTELKVSIRNNDVDIFFAVFFIDSMKITREATGTYVRPVPLGSPKNYFGTGNMLTGVDAENMWAAINGYCSPREQGDPFASKFQENWPITDANPTCPGGVENTAYVGGEKDQYQFSIYAPPGRTAPIVVHLYSPGLHPNQEAAATVYPANQFDTTFTLRSPDTTPFDDSDNPITPCSGLGELNPRSYGSFLDPTTGATIPPPNAESVWTDPVYGTPYVWSRFCTIPASAPSGTYLLGVRTSAVLTGSSFSNTFSVLASYNGTGARCDSSSDTKCPSVNPRDWMSVFAAASTNRASLYLAEVGAEHAGKTMEITLFDPGEGGDYIEIVDPAGNPVTFSYRSADGLFAETGVTRLDVSNCVDYVQPGRHSACKFNDRYVVMTVNLPSDYAARYPGTKWWKLGYRFTTKVQDRSTWSVRVIGDPVHLSN